MLVHGRSSAVHAGLFVAGSSWYVHCSANVARAHFHYVRYVSRPAWVYKLPQ